jgi:hypothetical protein
MVSEWTCIPRDFRGLRPVKKPAMGRRLAIAIAVSAICAASLSSLGTTAASAQAPTTVERSAKGATAKNIQVGVYLNVQPDCTSGTLPAIRLVNPPANGTISIKRGKVSATNYKQCLALEVPGFVAFYQSRPDFSGIDVVVLEIKYPQGRTELQRITIEVGRGGPSGQKI